MYVSNISLELYGASSLLKSYPLYATEVLKFFFITQKI